MKPIARKISVLEIGAWFLLALTLMVWVASAHAQDLKRVGGKFNHTSTGFPLTGVHVTVECETCHTGGIFKGTPTACEGCHAPGRRVVATGKSSKHIVTNSPCAVCHTNAVTFLGARFDHMGVQPGGCQSCHNSSMAPGKPAGHVTTTESCDQCHRSIAWIPAGYNHAGVTPGTCTNCHNGTTATARPANHSSGTMATGMCDTCHTTRAWRPANYHIGVLPGTCGTCHNGTTAIGKPVNHIPVSGNNCDSCHYSTSTGGFGPANQRMAHTAAGVPTTCVTCHLSGTSYLGNMEKQTLDHESPGKPDCSASGCHRPAGTVGTLYTSW